ncbi:MAG: S-adenosylmethionine:tRNA ribosyltransferase-isomerase, partial [Actinobacteria bacterium]|nr:S-adenosylmethionine:tRNA ribosyltransferase-isomerase [Actinomycetota bacterium]
MIWHHRLVETAAFRYDLPEDRIAQRPVEPRDSSRLLDTRTMADRRFSDLPALLRPGDLVVVNRTRVRRARLDGSKAGTGGSVEALLLAPLGDGCWEAL